LCKPEAESEKKGLLAKIQGWLSGKKPADPKRKDSSFLRDKILN
jgi:hypothetical protein